MGYLQGWHPVYLDHEAAGRPRRSRLGFICAGKACPIEFWLQICCLLELVTRMEWIVLNGLWCDSPGEALLPLPNGLNLAWCEKKAGHLLPQGDQSLEDYSRDNSKMCSQPLHSAHWALYDIPPLSFIIWNGSKTFHRASVSRACGCETAAAVDGWPSAVVQSDDGGKKIAGILFDSNSRQILEAPRGSIATRRATSRHSH